MSEDDYGSETDTKSNNSFVNLNQNNTGSAMFIGAKYSILQWLICDL